MFIYYFLFNKTISLFLQFICVSSFLYDYTFLFSKLSGPRTYPSLARRVWAGNRPETCEPGRAWAKYSRYGSGLGLSSSLRAWAGTGLTICCGPGPGLDSNCGPGLDSNYRPAQGTNVCMHVCTHVYKHVCVYVCMYVCMYACMYVGIYIYASMYACM